MSLLTNLDRQTRVALKDDVVNVTEAKRLVSAAKRAVKKSQRPGRTLAAVLDRFDGLAKNANIYDTRVVDRIDDAVRKLTDGAKTFDWVGIQNQYDDGGSSSSSRVSGGESSSTSSRVSGGESSSSSSRVSGGESSSSSYRSYTPTYTPRVSGGEW